MAQRNSTSIKEIVHKNENSDIIQTCSKYEVASHYILVERNNLLKNNLYKALCVHTASLHSDHICTNTHKTKKYSIRGFSQLTGRKDHLWIMASEDLKYTVTYCTSHMNYCFMVLSFSELDTQCMVTMNCHRLENSFVKILQSCSLAFHSHGW